MTSVLCPPQLEFSLRNTFVHFAEDDSPASARFSRPRPQTGPASLFTAALLEAVLDGAPLGMASASPPDCDSESHESEVEEYDKNSYFAIPSLKTRDFFEDTPKPDMYNGHFGQIIDFGTRPQLVQEALVLEPSPWRHSPEPDSVITDGDTAKGLGRAPPAKMKVRNTFVHLSDDEGDGTPCPRTVALRRSRTRTVPARVLQETLSWEEENGADGDAPGWHAEQQSPERLPALLQQTRPSPLADAPKVACPVNPAVPLGPWAACIAAGAAAAAEAAATAAAVAASATVAAATAGPMYLEHAPVADAETVGSPLAVRMTDETPNSEGQIGSPGRGHGKPAPRLKVSVRNTFLHIDEEAEGCEQAAALHQRASRRSKTGPAGLFAPDDASEDGAEADDGKTQAADRPCKVPAAQDCMDAAMAPAQATASSAVTPPGAFAPLGLPVGMLVPPVMPGFLVSAPHWAQIPLQALQLSPPTAPEAREAAAREAPAVGGSSSSGAAERGAAPDRTTVVLQNLPLNYRRHMLLRMLDLEGFAGDYDFVYLPTDFKTRAGFGYAFINLIDVSVVPRFWRVFDGYKKWIFPSAKVAHVSWSVPHQGLKAHVKRYRNSPLMHESVPDEYKPVLLSNGARVAFPPPTRELAAPQQKPAARASKGGRRRAAA